MAELIPEIVERRARRALSYREVEPGVVDRLLLAATLAPSCSNKQPWRFVVVREAGQLERLREGLSRGNAWARRSPCVVVVVTDPELDCRLPGRPDYALFDVGLAVGQLLLQATHEGLYAHPIAGFAPEIVRQVLGIPEPYAIVTLVILGYPGDEAALSEAQRVSEHEERSRKPLEEVAMQEAWRASP
jgi:nitroreductase